MSSHLNAIESLILIFDNVKINGQNLYIISFVVFPIDERIHFQNTQSIINSVTKKNLKYDKFRNSAILP